MASEMQPPGLLLLSSIIQALQAIKIGPNVREDHQGRKRPSGLGPDHLMLPSLDQAPIFWDRDPLTSCWISLIIRQGKGQDRGGGERCHWNGLGGPSALRGPVGSCPIRPAFGSSFQAEHTGRRGVNSSVNFFFFFPIRLVIYFQVCVSHKGTKG